MSKEKGDREEAFAWNGLPFTPPLGMVLFSNCLVLDGHQPYVIAFRAIPSDVHGTTALTSGPPLSRFPKVVVKQ